MRNYYCRGPGKCVPVSRLRRGQLQRLLQAQAPAPGHSQPTAYLPVAAPAGRGSSDTGTGRPKPPGRRARGSGLRLCSPGTLCSLNYILARVRLLGNLGISIHNSRLPSSEKPQGRGQALQVPAGPASFRTSCLATHTAHVSLSRLSGRCGRLCHGSRWWPTGNLPLGNFPILLTSF